jgi:proline dehydrogenase
MSVLRTLLIASSRSQPVQNAIVSFPVSRRMARRFVAGESLNDAINAVRKLNEQGMLATLDHLGENVSTMDEAVEAADEYLAALDALYLAGANSNVSIKLSQLGLDQDESFCYDNVARIVQKAAERDNFVRIDMEGSAYTERTLQLYRRLRGQYGNVGVVIQSYLYRSEADVRSLIEEGIGHFRLCKGAYAEPESIAYQDKDRVTQALNDLVSICLQDESRAEGSYCGIASHDEAVISFTRVYAYRHQVPLTAFEFQMLFGIRRELQAALVRQGYKVRIYVPYGTHWYPYFMRRLGERPANLQLFLRALVGD